MHSAKDVPGELPDGLAIVGVPERADPRDALCGAGVARALPEGARSAPRACAGARSCSPRGRTSTCVDAARQRGHAPAQARRGRLRRDRARGRGAARGSGAPSEGAAVAAELLLRPPGQGCLALEARADDARAAALAAALTDPRGARALLDASGRVVGALDAELPHAGRRARRARRTARLRAARLRRACRTAATWIRDALDGRRRRTRRARPRRGASGCSPPAPPSCSREAERPRRSVRRHGRAAPSTWSAPGPAIPGSMTRARSS